MKSIFIFLVSSMLLTACGPSAKEKAALAEEKRIHCLDHFCEGDVLPAYDTQKEVALKFGGHWYVGPKEYFSAGTNGASFDGGSTRR